jgi:hypothetical protein
MKRVTFVLAVLGLLVALPGMRGHGDQPKPINQLMQKKLQESQKVLEGIALSDFDKIARHAAQLSAISKMAEWRVIKTPRYEMYSDEFQRNADDLVKKATAKNLDAATLSYVELTLTCVRCHKYLREMREVSLDTTRGRAARLDITP